MYYNLISKSKFVTKKTVTKMKEIMQKYLTKLNKEIFYKIIILL